MFEKTLGHPAGGRRSLRLAGMALAILGVGLMLVFSASVYGVLNRASESFAWYSSPKGVPTVEGRSVRVDR